MNDDLAPLVGFRSTPWADGHGQTREIAVASGGADPIWRLIHGSTGTGGTWERLPTSHEALVIGVGGPRTELRLDGAPHRLSSSRALLVSPGATVRVDRNGSSRRSDMLLLSFDSRGSGRLDRRRWQGPVMLGDDDVVVVVLDGVLQVDGGSAPRGTVVRVRGTDRRLEADDVTAVVASSGPTR